VTIDEARQLPTVLTVEHAGRLLGLGRSAAYEAVRRGELPTLKFGRRLLVPTGKVLELLGLDPAHLAAAPTRSGTRRGAGRDALT
jgi:excisionase family DNA binding protein